MKISQYVLEAPNPKLTDALVVDESCLILPDVEVPYHHASFINKCISVAKDRKIKAAVYPGDWVHWGSLAKFPANGKDFEGEIDKVEDTIGGFIHPFERVYYCKGNHDNRLALSLDRFIRLEQMSKLMIGRDMTEEWNRKVQISDKYWLWVGQGEHRWRIGHPKATNTVPANAARKMAGRFGCNYVMTHNHLVGIQQTDDGRHFGIEIGCCVDPERLNYVQERDNTRPEMTLCALLLEKSGDRFYPTLLNEDLFRF